MQTKLARIAAIAKEKPNEKFTSLYHLLNEELLTQCHMELDGNKASGVDQVTKAAYEENLEENVRNLVDWLKKKSYRPQPVRSDIMNLELLEEKIKDEKIDEAIKLISEIGSKNSKKQYHI